MSAHILASVTNGSLCSDPLTNQGPAACVGISLCQPCQVSSGGNEANIAGGGETGRGGGRPGDKPSELREIRRRLVISHDGPEIITMMLLSLFDKFLQLYCVTLNAIKLQSFV